ncbi:cupin domain-containing protein [Rhodococcus artemisiae]
MRRPMRGVLAAIVIAGSVAVPGWAHATPSQGISGVTWVDIEIPPNLLPFVPAGVHAVAREITIDPGGTTGWHYHDGPVLGIVRAGTLTHPGADCVPVVYDTGDVIDEPAGADHVHVGRNVGTVPVVLDVVYLTPIGAPLSEDAPAPACATT